MLVVKKNAEEFYSEIRKLFPEIHEHSMWDEFSYEGEPPSNAGILTSIAEVVIEWTINGEFEEVEKILAFIEQGYQDFRDDIMCYVYTDFHPTIIATEIIGVRERIKVMMGAKTKLHYDQLIDLGFYAEHE
ncbi:MAG: hypothetical protein ACI8YO_002215 [Gammaproteobacteria bacterium]|jgi:hypothetical protein